jgi:HxlR-like helix-turn-helix
MSSSGAFVHHQVPPKVDYSLTDWGQALCPALDALLTWVDLKETLTEAPHKGHESLGRAAADTVEAKRLQYCSWLPSQDHVTGCTGEARLPAQVFQGDCSRSSHKS